MEYSFYDFLKLIGSLGLFLYGMKIMSEGLQKVAGDRLRSILTAMTTNRVTGVLTGVLITALIQSSSATTVMVVSFVNAGLLTLAESISVIMGANIGTTITGQLIALDIGAIAPLIAFIGVASIMFIKNEKVKLSNIQIAKKNKFIDPYSLVQMLWKNEVLEELDKRGLSKGYKSKSKNILWERLVNNLSHKELLEMVKEKLKSRNQWRTVEQQE